MSVSSERTWGSSSTIRMVPTASPLPCGTWSIAHLEAPRAGRRVSGLRAGAGDGVVDAVESGIELGGFLAAGLGEIRPTAAAATDGPCDLLHELAGVETLREVLGHRRDQVHLAVHDAADEHDAGAEPLAQTVGHRAQTIGVEPVDAPGHHRHTVHLAGAGHEIVGLRARGLALQLLQLALERALLVEQLAQPLRRLGRRD